ncbi:hypothetical protein PR048_010701 [Dryococelus australis]|uniref:Uncharacterized protein n=1 Tax=Dryococelus australis TaxID=614101 RepID=A0ABQ9I497_9NEOP|nr:hypothetical protein PR048_010701 [Dryococelus australis]
MNDEQIVPFKGQSSLKSYNSKKPNILGIGALSSIKINRYPGLSFSSDKEMKKRGRDCSEERETQVDGIDIREIKWYDNHRVVTWGCNTQNLDRNDRLYLLHFRTSVAEVLCKESVDVRKRDRPSSPVDADYTWKGRRNLQQSYHHLN